VADEITNLRGVKNPDYEFTVTAVGVDMHNGTIHWWLDNVSPYEDEEFANLLEKLVKAIRDARTN